MLKKSSNSVKVIFPNKERVFQFIKEYVEKLKKNVNVKKVILIGSYARGDFLPSSDIDIVIVVEKSDKRFCDRMKEFYDENAPCDLDVFVYTEKEFESKKDKKPIKEGKILFER